MTSTVPSKKPYRKAPPQHREIHHELPILCDEYDGVILAEQNQEPLTDAERIKLLQHDNEELRRRLAYVTNKMEAMERELESGQDYLEMELGQNREELEKFKDKFRRLQNSYTASQRTNQDLEEKLHALASLSQNWIFAVASFRLCVILFLFTCFSLSSFIVVHALLSPTCTVFDGIQSLNQPTTWV